MLVNSHHFPDKLHPQNVSIYCSHTLHALHMLVPALNLANINIVQFTLFMFSSLAVFALCYACETMINLNCDMHVVFLYEKEVHEMGKGL